MSRPYTPRTSRGGGNFLKPEVVALLRERILQGLGARTIATELDIAQHTVLRHRSLIVQEGVSLHCACGGTAGHKGWCAVRLTRSEARQEFLKTWARWKAPALVRATSLERRVVLSYPYLDSGTISNSDLLTAVNALVPRTLPEHIRADVCQEMIVDILCGDLALADGARLVRKYISRSWGDSYRVISLDAPIRGTDNLRLIDTIEDGRFHF